MSEESSESMNREEVIAAVAQRLIQASEKVSNKDDLEDIESFISLDESLKDILNKAKEEIEKYDIEVDEVMKYMVKKRPDMVREFSATSSPNGLICVTENVEMDDDEKYIFKSAPMEIRSRIVNSLATDTAINVFKNSIAKFGTMPCVFFMTVEKNLSFKITQGFPSFKIKGKEELLEKTIESLSEKVSEGKGAVIEIRRVFSDKVRMVVRVEGKEGLGVTNIHYFKCSRDGEDMSTDPIKSFEDGYSHNKWVSVQLCESLNKDSPDKDNPDPDEPKEEKTPTANKFKNRLNEIGG